MRMAEQKGVAILTALGVLVLLGLLSSVFLAHMRLEAAYTKRDAQELKAYYLAAAGVEDAIARLKADPPMVDAYSDEWWPGAAPGITPLGDGGYTLTVTDESARVNVLTASAQVLSAILGGDNEAVAAITGDYRSSNRLFSIDDLSGAGFSADALSRVMALGTTLGDGKININTASVDVVAALTGMDAETAQLVIEFRRGPDGVEGSEDDFVFASSADLAKVPGLTSLRTNPVVPLLKMSSDIFRVESVGSVHIGRRVISNRKITAVLHRDSNRNISILSWESS